MGAAIVVIDFAAAAVLELSLLRTSCSFSTSVSLPAAPAAAAGVPALPPTGTICRSLRLQLRKLLRHLQRVPIDFPRLLSGCILQ